MSSEILEIKDMYNPVKIWLIKRTSCGHYYMNQKIKGNLINKKYIKTTKKHLQRVGVL